MNKSIKLASVWYLCMKIDMFLLLSNTKITMKTRYRLRYMVYISVYYNFKIYWYYLTLIEIYFLKLTIELLVEQQRYSKSAQIYKF